MVINDSYCKYKRKIYNCSEEGGKTILRSHDYSDCIINGFKIIPGYKENPAVGGYKHIKRVPTSRIDWFCYVFTVGYYKGCEVSIRWEKNGKYRIDISNVSDPNSKEYKVFTTENGFRMYDRYDWCGDVPKSEVQGIEQRVGPARPDLKTPDKWNFQIPGDDNEFPRRVVQYE